MHAAAHTLEHSLTVRVPHELHSRLTALAKTTGRTKSFYVLDNLKERIEHDLWEIEQTQAAIEEADRGEFTSDEEVNALFAKYEA
jgi:predicted transcriptional regulator